MDNMEKINLIETMQDIVNKNVEHFKNDFLFDIDFMYTMHDKKFVWIVRKYGTNIARLWPDVSCTTEYTKNKIIENGKIALSSFYKTNKKTTIKNKFFIVDLENNEIRKIDGRTINRLLAD